MQFVDVLVEDDDGTQNSLVALVESVQRPNQYTIRYLSPTKRVNIYKLEKVTYVIDLQSINYFYDGLKDFGFTETDEGWVKISESDDSDYSASSCDESDDESLEDESESEEESLNLK